MTSPVHYFIVERWTDAEKRRRETWAQQEVGTTRKEVFEQIIGEDLTPFQILEVIPDEKIVNDITRDVAEQVRDHFVDGVPERLVDFVESNTPGLVRAA